MTKRRGRGEGCLEHRGGDTWRLRVYVGKDPVTGKPRQLSRTIRAKSKTAATAAMRQFTHDISEGKVIAHKGSVAFLLEQWLGLVARDRAKSTIETYRLIVDKHLAPAFGQKDVRHLMTYDLDAYYRRKQEEGLAERTVRLHHAILSAALSQAVAWDWLDRNPAERASPPKVPRGQKSVPEVDQVRALVDACGPDQSLAAVITLAALTGCRRGELCGLRWSDVDWSAATLRVERQRVPLKGGDQTASLKHGEGRTVALGDLGMVVLARWRDAYDARAAALGPSALRAADPKAWLLSPNGEDPWRAKQLGEAITALGREAKIPVTTHAFRRFAATQLVGSGADVRTVAGRLGHTPDVLLRVYAGFLPERDRAAANVLEATVLGPTTKEEA